MKPPLETVVELHLALTELKQAESQLQGIPDWMQELHEQHSSRQAEIRSLAEAAQAAAKDRRQAETAIEDAQQKQKHYQDQISRVSTQREYGALLKEIDTVKAQISSLEEAALSAMELHEENEKKLNEEKAAFRELDDRYSQELDRWESEKPQVEAQAEKLRGRIEVLRERLPRAALAEFERVSTRHEGQALAQVRRVERTGSGPHIWHCAACNYRVRPQAVVEISNGSLALCDGCKRILFVAEAES